MQPVKNFKVTLKILQKWEKDINLKHYHITYNNLEEVEMQSLSQSRLFHVNCWGSFALHLHHSHKINSMLNALLILLGALDE